MTDYRLSSTNYEVQRTVVAPHLASGEGAEISHMRYAYLSSGEGLGVRQGAEGRRANKSLTKTYTIFWNDVTCRPAGAPWLATFFWLVIFRLYEACCSSTGSPTVVRAFLRLLHLLTTRHSPLVTHHSSLVTSHSSLAIRHSPFVTSH